MLAVHIVVGVAALVAVLSVLLSVLRGVVLPRGVPTRLARVAVLGVRVLLLGRLRLRGGADYATRDRVLALQAPLGVFAQLVLWATLIVVCFAALFWSLSGGAFTGHSAAHAIELAGSSVFTLGSETPHGVTLHILGFVAAGVGLILLAIVIGYLPTLYTAFSRREATVAKLAVRAGSPTTGEGVLVHTWELNHFDEFRVAWDGWEDWFLDIGETHTTFPQLTFFRSSRPAEHWVLAAEAILDAATLLQTACDIEDTSRAQLCQRAGGRALDAVAEFLGIPRLEPAEEPDSSLPRGRFDEAFDGLARLGVPMAADRDDAWRAFVAKRCEYEPLISALGAMTDAPRSEWSSWTDDTPRHNPPLLRIHQD